MSNDAVSPYSCSSSECERHNAAVELLEQLMDCASLVPQHVRFAAASARSIRTTAHDQHVEGSIPRESQQETSVPPHADSSAKVGIHERCDAFGEEREKVFLPYVAAACRRAASSLADPATTTTISSSRLTVEEHRELRDVLSGWEARVVFADIFLLPRSEASDSEEVLPLLLASPPLPDGAATAAGTRPNMRHVVARLDFPVGFSIVSWREVSAKDGTPGPVHANAGTDVVSGEDVFESLLSLIIHAV